MIEYDLSTPAIDKLKKLYFLHTDLEGLYYLLFKAVFEIKNSYPHAYQTAVRYRTWLKMRFIASLDCLNPMSLLPMPSYFYIWWKAQSFSF